LVHGVYRANTPERQQRRRMFIDDLKRHVPVHPVTDEAGEIIGRNRRSRSRLSPSHWIGFSPSFTLYDYTEFL
jgi:hypothetical protein